MAERFVVVDRNTPMLLAPDLREWVAEDDLARLVIEAVEQTDLSLALVNVRGSGSGQYPPGMMLALLIYCYARGIFSSRRIEQCTYENVSVRYICANTHPDHDTIAKFRRENAELFKQCFCAVLLLGREMGLVRLGAVAIDGSRMEANVSAAQWRTAEQLEAEERRLKGVVEQLYLQAEQADQQDSEGQGSRLPQQLADAKTRQRKLAEANQRLKAVRASTAKRSAALGPTQGSDYRQRLRSGPGGL
jgi:transposase